MHDGLITYNRLLADRKNSLNNFYCAIKWNVNWHRKFVSIN